MRLAAAMVASLMGLAAPLSAQSSLPSQSEMARADMIERVSRSLVHIKGSRAAPPMRDPTEGMSEKEKEKLLKRDPLFVERWKARTQQRASDERSEGSGFVIDGSKGLILTAAHIINGLDQLSAVLPDGSKQNADLVGVDRETGIAVLRIANRSLPSLTFSPRKPRAGEAAINLGQMLPMHGTMASQGMVMGELGSDPNYAAGLPELGEFMLLDNFLPHGGFGGGPVVNARGEVIGLITAIVGARGYSQGSASVMNVASGFRAALDRLASQGKVVRGKIGLAYDCLPKGCSVIDVAPGGPADKAGLKVGDVVLAVNGKAVANNRALRRSVGLAAPGTNFVFAVERDGKMSDFTLASIPGDEVVAEPEPVALMPPPAPVRID